MRPNPRVLRYHQSPITLDIGYEVKTGLAIRESQQTVSSHQSTHGGEGGQSRTADSPSKIYASSFSSESHEAARSIKQMAGTQFLSSRSRTIDSKSSDSSTLSHSSLPKGPGGGPPRKSSGDSSIVRKTTDEKKRVLLVESGYSALEKSSDAESSDAETKSE